MKRNIEILLKSIADKSGFTAVTDGAAKYKKGLGDLSKAGRVVAQVFGGLGGIIGKFTAVLAGGGVFTIAAEGVRTIFSLIKERAEKAAEAAKEAFDKMAKGVADNIATIGAAFNAAVAKIDKMTASYDKQAAAVKNLVLAQIELEKQRNIAGGMSTEEASAIAAGKSARAGFDADEKVLRHHIEMNQRKVAEARKAEEEETAIAETNARKRERLRAAYASKRDRYVDRKSITEGVSTSGLGYNSAADVAADRAAKGREFDESKEGKELLRQLAELDKNTEAAKAKAKEAVEVAEKAAAEIANAQSGIAAIAERRAAQELAEINERTAAEKKAAEEQAKAREKAAKEAAEAEEKAIEESVKAMDELSKKVNAEQAKLERQQLQDRIKAVQEANAKEVAELDKKLAAERQKAAEWERDAQKARNAALAGGGGFNDWEREGRGGGKEERRQRRMQEAAERRARDTIRDLERRSRQQRGGLNADQQRRLDAARRFIEMQDPNKNPAAKRAEELEKQRLAAINKTTKAVDDLRKAVEQRTVL